MYDNYPVFVTHCQRRLAALKGVVVNHVLFPSVLGQPGILPDGDLCAGGGAARRFSHALCV